jgi:hypothetical protein
MSVVADILPHIVAAPRHDINDERELNVSSSDRTARGDLSREAQLNRVGLGIESIPGEQGALLHLELVRGWNKGEPGADQVALRIMLQFRMCS